MSTIQILLVIVLVCLLLGVLPTWNYSRNWGYGPMVLVIVLLVILMVVYGRVPL